MAKEYIEREALRKLMYEEAFEKDSDMQRWDSGCWIRYKLFENCIEAIPAADVVPVRHGHFGEKTSPFTAPCSECGTSMNTHWHYCPNCGARMDGDGE